MTRLFSHRIATWMLALALGIPFAALAQVKNPPVKLKLDATPINREVGRGNSYSSVVKKASPSVVNIYSTKTVKAPRYHQFFEDPMFDRFFGDGGQRRRGGGQRSFEQTSLGSGVIVSEDGYILTNNHVVDGADPDGVEVALGDGQRKFKAKVIGNDPQTDLAVLKVDAKDLPAITIADSDKIEVGDVVLAIGNPFNVGQSVTMGIVSAFGRGGFGITDYEDFIQTDAPINPGNSGGALVDTDGRLIGINQSIVSRSGGNAGVGFAVPVNQARIVLERLVADGTVRRGYLGVLIQPVTPELAKAFNLPADSRGALVGGVSPETPAAKAGIKEGDVITEVNGRKANDSQQVRLMISQLLPGTKANLKILRDGRERTMAVTLGELSKEGEVVEAVSPDEPVAVTVALEGVELGDLTSATRREHGVANHVRGALVVNVEPDSKAATAGLRPGNVIQEINRQIVESADEAAAQLQRVRGEQLLLRVWSRSEGMSGSRFVTVDAPKK